MENVIRFRLGRHSRVFQADESAHALLSRYLERARISLGGDPGQDDVIGDLEQAIGEKIAGVPSPESHIVDASEMSAILEEIGPVAPVGLGDDVELQPGARRRLYRIQEGQWFAGVCQGLALYSSIRVDWIRSLFVIMTVATGGLLALVYMIMMFLLPVVSTREEALTMQRLQPDRPLDAPQKESTST